MTKLIYRARLTRPVYFGGNLLPLLCKMQDSCKSALASRKICKPKTRKWHFHARKLQREMEGNLQAETPEQISCKISCAGRGKFLYTIYTLIWVAKLVYNRCYTLIWVPCKEILYTIYTLIISCKDLQTFQKKLQILADISRKSANPCVIFQDFSCSLQGAKWHTPQNGKIAGKVAPKMEQCGHAEPKLQR